MTDQYVAEIRLVPYTFAPSGWAFCEGQLMPISQNTALFSLLGTNYGGDGKSTFGLPDLRGAVPLGWGTGSTGEEFFVGEQGGTPQVTLQQSEIPVHTHGLLAVPAPGTTGSPSGASFAEPHVGRLTEAAYGSTGQPGATQLHPLALPVTGGSLPHNNLQPTLVLGYIIALQGIFPPRG